MDLNKTKINKVGIVGSGTMGSQIAALFANYGIPVLLLDVETKKDGFYTSEIAEAAIKRLQEIKPSPIINESVLELIETGNTKEDMKKLNEVDWVIEAVSENINIKKTVWQNISRYVDTHTILSTNTSGILISSIMSSLPQKLKNRFMGTHFFNPPRYLKLLEIIPTEATDSQIIASVTEFAENVLEKGVVICKDVPNFIGNRLWLFSIMATLKYAEKYNIKPNEVDAITGSFLGRPKSATFRTMDIVGLDVLVAICDNLIEYFEGTSEKEYYEVPSYLRELVKRGWIGAKSGQGIYRKSEFDGRNIIETIDLNSFEYSAYPPFEPNKILSVSNIDDTGLRIKKVIYDCNDNISKFVRDVLLSTLIYTASKSNEIAYDLASVDNAMKWGFGWELGPFELWDILGLGDSLKLMNEIGMKAPQWVELLSEKSNKFFEKDIREIDHG